MAKRQLDAFFDTARDSIPKPHAHGPVAVRSLLKPELSDATECYKVNSKQTPFHVTSHPIFNEIVGIQANLHSIIPNMGTISAMQQALSVAPAPAPSVPQTAGAPA